MFSAFIKGFILGLVAGVPLGPASATVAESAIRRGLKTAIAVGFGGALVDFTYSSAVAAGYGIFLSNHPDVSELLQGIGGVVLIVFGLFTLLKKHDNHTTSKPLHLVQESKRTIFQAILTGIGVSVMNPSLLVSWVVLAGTVLLGLTPFEGFIAGTGVFIGVFLWFLIVALLSHYSHKRWGGEKAGFIPRFVGFVLILYGISLLVKIAMGISTLKPMIH